MNILYVNGADQEGGAARAAIRLLQGVRKQGIEARLLVQRKYGQDPLVSGPRSAAGKLWSRVRPTMEQLICGLSPASMRGPFCAAFLPDTLLSRVAAQAPDIIHLHWVARMMRLETLSRFKQPLVWTLHDSWPFTGGCYLPGECSRYRESCGRCPVFGSPKENDLSRRVWERKQRVWSGLKLTLVAPSRWMADCARSSALFHDMRIEVIPNGIDVNLNRPHDRNQARDRFALPHDKQLILFGAKSATEDPNKGFHLLAGALRELSALNPSGGVELVIFGSDGQHVTEDAGVRTRYLGWLDDEPSLAHLYSAADILVLPSLQESLGYTVMEAMACGTPCVAFNQGGVPDLIDHHHNGYLARPYETSDLARGMSWLLDNEERRRDLSRKARRKINEVYAVEKVAERHLTLYRELVAS